MSCLAVLLILTILQASVITQSENFIGVLSGPERSGEQHQYVIDIEPGTLLIVSVSFKSLEGVGARIYAAISEPSGGNYAYADELLASSSSRTLNLSYYFGSSTDARNVRLLVGSVADRYAPALIRYDLTVHRYRLLDMGLADAGDSLEAPLMIDLIDGERADDAHILSINGYLSPSGLGNDHADYYLIRLPVKDDYVVSAEIMSDSSSLINAYIRLSDGYPVSRISGSGITAMLKNAGEFLVSVETYGASSSIISYNLTLRVSRLSNYVENESRWALINLDIVVAALLGLAVALLLMYATGIWVSAGKDRKTLASSYL
ncbi:MAG: hypothetical protein QW689_01280 [Nitrososphaerota archaeon]